MRAQERQAVIHFYSLRRVDRDYIGPPAMIYNHARGEASRINSPMFEPSRKADENDDEGGKNALFFI